jgi:hypothetical protein
MGEFETTQHRNAATSTTTFAAYPLRTKLADKSFTYDDVDFDYDLNGDIIEKTPVVL